MQTKNYNLGYAMYKVRNGRIIIDDNEFHKGKLCGFKRKNIKQICKEEKLKIGKFSVVYILEEEVDLDSE